MYRVFTNNLLYNNIPNVILFKGWLLTTNCSLTQLIRTLHNICRDRDQTSNTSLNH